MAIGLRICTDPHDPSVIHVYDSKTGAELNSSIVSGTLHMQPGNITATLEVLVDEVDVVTTDVKSMPLGVVTGDGVAESLEGRAWEWAEAPFTVRILDRRDAEKYVDGYLDWNESIPWSTLSDVGKQQARVRLKDEACDPYNINYRGHRVSKALIALFESRQ